MRTVLTKAIWIAEEVTTVKAKLMRFLALAAPAALLVASFAGYRTP